MVMEETDLFSSPLTFCFAGSGSACNSATEIKVYALVFLHTMIC